MYNRKGAFKLCKQSSDEKTTKQHLHQSLFKEKLNHNWSPAHTQCLHHIITRSHDQDCIRQTANSWKTSAHWNAGPLGEPNENQRLQNDSRNTASEYWRELIIISKLIISVMMGIMMLSADNTVQLIIKTLESGSRADDAKGCLPNQIFTNQIINTTIEQSCCFYKSSS